MAVLSKAEVDSLVAELSPKIGTEAQRTELGVEAYKKLFGAHPEYIPLFSKLEGLDATTVWASEGIKHYGRTLVDELVAFVKAACDDGETKKEVDRSGHEHTKRNVNKDQFKSGIPIFVEFFNATLTKPENQKAMAKLLESIMPQIADQI